MLTCLHGIISFLHESCLCCALLCKRTSTLLLEQSRKRSSMLHRPRRQMDPCNLICNSTVSIYPFLILSYRCIVVAIDSDWKNTRGEEEEKIMSSDAEKAIPANVRMFSGCEDKQTSADVSNVSSFKLPDPHGKRFPTKCRYFVIIFFCM